MSVFAAGAELAGERLDRGLGVFLSIGLRGRKRLIADGHVLLNGKTAHAAARLKAGDRIEILRAGPKTAKTARFLGVRGDFYFFYKPAGLHTEALAGRENASLEKSLPRLERENSLPSGLTLLQRLDFGTSGIVCATLNGGDFYRRAEKAGEAQKYYFALLQGVLEEETTARNRLDTNGGAKVRFLPEAGPELAWTKFAPLWRGECEGFPAALTLAKCVIRRGVRHQIRAHAAALGRPLAGDELYGGGAGNFLLENYGVEFPGVGFFYDSPDSALNAIPELVFAKTREIRGCI